MAAVTTEEVRRRNCRLEAFLKRTLDVESYERIRAHEACIVCSERDTRAFKFIIISDEWVYLSENPPKKLSPVIHFRDISSVSLATDLAVFLSGTEQENAQHIIIKYKTDEVPRPSKEERATPETERTPTDQLLLTTQALKSNRLDALSYTARHGYINRVADVESSLGGRNTNRHVTFDTELALTEQDLDNGSMNLNHTEGKREVDGKKLLSKVSEKKEKRLTRNLLQGKKKKGAKSLSKSLDEEILHDALKHKDNGLKNADEQIPEGGRKRGKKKKALNEAGAISIDSGSSGTNEMSLNLNLTSVTNTGKDSPRDLDTAVIPPLDLSALDQPFTPRSILRLTNRSSNTSDTSSERDGLREGTFDLYILDNSSKILMFIQSAWDSYKIRGTLEEEPGFFTQRRILFTARDGPAGSEKLENLFIQLKSELLQSGNQLEDVFHLVRELKMGTERNFTLKRLFWKTSDMFNFFIAQLKKYLPGSGALKEVEALERADQLELLLLILETFALMFRETEILSSRVQQLKDREGATLRDLLYLLTCQPQLAAPNSPVCSTLLELNEELTARASGVLFELITLAGQNSVAEVNSFISVSWIMATLESLDTLFSFTERLVRQALTIVRPSSLDELSPEEAILLYHQFRVLVTLTHYNRDVLAFIQETFCEEFKYYVHMTIINRKLPSNYLIRPYVLQDIETVTSRVLQRNMTSRRLPLSQRSK